MALPAWLARWLPKRPAARRFDGAQYNRLTASWQGAERSINTELRGDLDALRRRARDLSKNSPLGRKFLGMCVTNIAGPGGFRLQARAADNGRQDTLANDAIERAWTDWSKPRNCDVAGRMSFAAMTRAIVRAVARDGEAIVRVRQGAANPYRLALQLLDIERLDTTLNREAAEGQNAIIMGVEIDADGRPVRYWMLAAPHGRDPTGKRAVPVPAAEILHLFVTDDPEQVRGIPWMHAVMITTNDLKGYNHAAIVAARIGASKMGFFTTPDGTPGALQDGEDAAGIPFTQAEPGQFGIAPAGYDFKSFDPDYPHANYGAFVKEHKRDIATGLGVAYNTLANDLEGVNFSSIRSGTLEERDNWLLAQSWLVEAFLDPVFDLWLDNALLAGAITMPNGSALPAAKRAKFAAHEFQGRRWQWVDPLKDIQASIAAIDRGLASPYTIAAQQGLDVDDVLDDIARFQAAAKEKGVALGAPAAPASAVEPPPAPDDGSKAMLATVVAAHERLAEMVVATLRSIEQRTAAPMTPPSFVLGPDSIRVTAEIETPGAVVNVTNHVPEQPPAPVEVRVEAIMPEQPAPVVEVSVEAVMPERSEVAIVSMPDRRTTTEIKRDSVGNITSSAQLESDA